MPIPACVTVLLPLAVGNSFTYTLPPELAPRVQVGSRVVVQFGPRRYYTGIVTSLVYDTPQSDRTLKAVTDVAGEGPIALPLQLKLWEWMSGYYMCHPGEVMKAALPTGLKLESETRLTREAEPDLSELSERDRALVEALDPAKGITLQQLEKKLGTRQSLLAPVRRLMRLGVVKVYETLAGGFKPLTETYVRLAAAHHGEAEINRLFDSLRRSPAQTALLTRYLDLAGAGEREDPFAEHELPGIRRRELCPDPRAQAALKALIARGALETYAHTVSRLDTDEEERRPAESPTLSPAQQRAYDEIAGIFATKPVCLLHGVTSSGKTEVYIRLIEHVLSRGLQVLYLVPEIALTTQITERLSRVFGGRMGVYHSKYPDAERAELWQRQLSGEAFPLILGVRSSLFLPFRHLGLVIVDEEHDASYKQADPAPRYQARDMAIVLARLCGARVLLGTATPSIESYHNALSGKYGLVKLTERYGGVELPRIEVADVKELRRKKLMHSPFSPRLIEAVRGALSAGKQAILFQNRRGWSPVLECRACGWVPRCTKCDVSLTYHQTQGRLVCHYCGATYDVPHTCPACGGTELRDMGYGTEKIESEAQRLFPEARTARLDLDTTRSRAAYERVIRSFAEGETNLLIGTQMVTKGLDFGGVTVVGILSADQMLNLPDYRATERAYQMMRQVAGRAGRRDGQGLVILQTRQADLPAIAEIVRGDYETMYREQLAEREAFGFPPSCRLISITVKHKDEQVAAHAADALAQLLRPHFGPQLLGPDRPLVGRIQLLYLRKLLVKVSHTLPPAGVRRTLFAARDIVLSQAPYRSVQVVFDVDP